MSARASASACEAWKLIEQLYRRLRDHVPAVAADLELSPQQCQVLRLIEPGAPIPMRRLAEALGCDASNVTGIVDRLEARGLVERRIADHDRRVKVLAVTPHGEAARRKLAARMAMPPHAIARLPDPDLRALCDVLRRVLRTDAPDER